MTWGNCDRISPVAWMPPGQWTLGELQREVVRLHYLEGRTYEEISTELGKRKIIDFHRSIEVRDIGANVLLGELHGANQEGELFIVRDL